MKNEPELTGSMHLDEEAVHRKPDWRALAEWSGEKLQEADAIIVDLKARYNALKDAAQELMKQSAPICNAECLTSWKNENEFDQAYLAVKALLNRPNITEMK